MHADAVQSAAETYMGLVEIGVGLIPGGGGTKEMALRASDSYYSGYRITKIERSFKYWKWQSFYVRSRSI